MLYLIGSLRNPEIPVIGNALRDLGYDVFDDWHAAGPHADDEWKRYEQERGHSYRQALKGYAARNVFNFDLTHLNRASSGMLILPAGRSGHLELGRVIGQGKPGYVVLDDPERWDVMYQFCSDVFFSIQEMLETMKRSPLKKAA